MNTNIIPPQKIKIFNYELSVEKKGRKKYYYQLNKDEAKEFGHTHDKRPIELNETSQIVRRILNTLSGKITVKSDDGIEGLVSDEQIKNKIMQSLTHIDQALEGYELNRESIELKQAEEEKEKYLEEITKKADEFQDFLIINNISLHTFIWYICEWLSGGESKNSMIGLICHLSTYFKIKPVWFLTLGKAGEGKSVIDNNSQVLTPNNAVMNGRISEKAIYRKTIELGERYLDGKILTMKDLGGSRDIEKWMDTLDRYKELTTDGITEFELVSDTPDELTGERKTRFFIVKGNPSVCLTSVNTESFDDQIMRRGVNVSPEATDEQVKKFYHFNKGLIKEERRRILNDELLLFHAYIEYIYEYYHDIEIINPYWTCLEKWFKNSEYYKSSLSLYPSLVEAVTLLHYHDRETIIFNDKNYLVSTKFDNKLIADLFNPSQGMSESSVRVFNLLLKWYKPFSYDELEAYKIGDITLRDADTFFTVGEVKYKTSRVKALSGLPIGEIINTLQNNGLIEAVDKVNRGNKNIYVLSEYEPLESSNIIFDDDMINDYLEDIEYMYGIPPRGVSDIIIRENRNKTSDNSIGDLKLPPWFSKSPLVSVPLYTGSPLKSAEGGFVYRPSPPSSPLKSAKNNLSEEV
ncbi:MAG: hypothetical protein ISP01_05425 [Methanobrevibacter arboriphilus]|uniref:Uncharacterized protein n=1 Tax=Methanobrevibacter arboriphilus TaxID=39441 RepID=A0A843ANG1_METAZ|nr:hypothetical protein [Methanobrevibacter arboriphilus]MBF4468829.1 hypothetical protein [Methanobrevibacter arboriphilus]